MSRRWSRRAGPEHPVLFANDDDFPPEPVRPDPAAADLLDPYRLLLDDAGMIELCLAQGIAPGHDLVVAGRRESAPAHDQAAAVLDDGTGRMRLVLPNPSTATLRQALQGRLLLVRAHTALEGDSPVLRVVEVHDLRRLGDEHLALQRAARH